MSSDPHSHPHTLGAADDPDPTRRRFIGRLAAGLGALIGAVVAVPPLGLLLHPILGRPRDAAGPAWSGVGSIDRFVVGGAPVRVVLKEDRVDAWLSSPGTPVGPVIVQRLTEEGFRVLSGICPHLGCSVSPKPGASRGFLCPCHRSNFGEDGALLAYDDGRSNPSPRALDPLEWRVRSGRLEVQWVRYETGVDQRVPIADATAPAHHDHGEHDHAGCAHDAPGGRDRTA